jgi:hypothetical protein
MVSTTTVEQAFARLASVGAQERGFLQHVLMRALQEPDLVDAPGLADNLPLVPFVLRSLPVAPNFFRTLPNDEAHQQWAAGAVRDISARVARSTNIGDGNLLTRLVLTAIDDPRFVAHFLENRHPEPFLDDDDAPLGHRVDLSALPRPTSVRVLEATGGEPALVELRGESGATYVEWRSDRRSLVVRSERRAIAEYLAGRTTTRELLTTPNDDVGFLVRGSDRIELVAVSKLPAEMLPSEDARHESTRQPAWETVPQSFLVDRRWSPGLFYDLEKSYQTAFALAYFLARASQHPAPSAIRGFILDGYGYANMYRSVRHSVPHNDNAHTSSVAAASPGVLTIDAPQATASILMAALERARTKSAKRAYRLLHRWSRVKEKDMKSLPESALDDISGLCTLLDVDSEKLLSGPSSELRTLRAGKMVAAYYRTLRKLDHLPSGVEFVTPPSGQGPEYVRVALVSPLRVSDSAGESDDEYDVFGDDRDYEGLSNDDLDDDFDDS